MEPEENDGDDEKSERDSIDYPTSEGDNDVDDNGDDLSEDDADNEDDEESSDKVERLLAIPTPPLSPVSLTSYTLPPLLMPFPVYTPLLTSSFSLPSSIPSTSGSESIPEADIPLQKRAHFTTPTSRYEIGESYIAAARHVRPTLTIAESRRADVTRGPYEYISDSDGGFTEGGTEGVVELTRWFEKMESVFSISNCTASNQEAYAMTWATLKKKMTGKYCPRGEIRKIKTEMWNLK
nr:hypothetical protein [Tanacetum cinerariifolium]